MNNKQGKRFLLSVCACIFLFSGCGTTSATVSNASNENSVIEVKETAGREIQTTKATIMNIEKVYLSNAQIAPAVTELKFQDSGTFLQYNIKLGDTVEKGDILAVTDDEALEEKIKDAKEAIESSTKSYEHNIENYNMSIKILKLELLESTLTVTDKVEKKLAIEKQELLIQQEKERYELEQEKKEKELKELEDQVGKNIIVAPHSGTVIYLREIYKGFSVNDISTYIGISDETNFYAVSDKINQRYLTLAKDSYILKDGKKYTVTFVTPDSEVEAKLQANGITLHSTFQVDEPDDSFEYSEYALLSIVTDKAEKVIGIPKVAVKGDTVGRYVYVQENGEKVKTYIKIGISDDVNTEVKEGLKEGDVVYVEN